MVGLGNPGPQYRDTRHNVGFLVIDRLLSRLPITSSRNKFDAEVFEAREGAGNILLLLKPQTFMNLSGKTVAAVTRYYDVPLEDLMIVCDDFHLPLGRLRFRRGGSHGGQNGLADIMERLGTRDFARLRVGIAAPVGSPISHVLGSFAPDERDVINEAVERAAEALLLWVGDGLEAVMNRYNAA